jgi:coproporphyrinogen III oxidase
MIKAWFFACIQIVLHNIDPAIPDGAIYISDANWDMEVIYVGGSMDLSPYWESILSEAKTEALAMSNNPSAPDRILYSITTSGGDCSH